VNRVNHVIKTDSFMRTASSKQKKKKEKVLEMLRVLKRSDDFPSIS